MIETALRAYLAGLALPAAEVAVQTQPRVGPLLTAALSGAPAALEELITIEEGLPYPSVALARADLAATQRIRRELPQDADKQTIAQWADSTAIRLFQVGRPAEALSAEQEAAAMYRELAAVMPDRYRPELAITLSNLGHILSVLGRNSEAEAARREAESIR